jgi:hypothetical protein
MKARITAQTTLAGFTPVVQEATAIVARQMANSMYNDIIDVTNDRVILALALALNDKLGYKARGIQTIVSAVGEIVDGYDETERGDDRDVLAEIRCSNNAMIAELRSRGIELDWKNV